MTDTPTIFTRTFWAKGPSTLRCHDSVDRAIKWTREGMANGATRAVAWTGAQDRMDKVVGHFETFGSGEIWTA